MGNEDEDTLYAFNLFVNVVGIFIVLFVGLIFIKKQNDSKSGSSIVILFYVSFVLVLIYLIFGTTTKILYFSAQAIPYQTFMSIQRPFGLFFYLIPLLTLVLRLHITFKDSTFRMSTRTIYLFSILLIVCIIAAIVNAIGTGVLNSDSDQTVTIGEYMVSVFYLLYWLLYFVGSTAAVWYFVGNLSKLAKLRSTSLRDVTVKEDDIKLDSTQQRMVNLSAKYILLFCVAMLSTVLVIVGHMSLGFIQHDSGLFVIEYIIWAFDFCLNFICLYLQFSFATEHYHTFCGCLDKICRKMVSKRTQRAIHRQSISRCEIQSGRMNMHSSSEIKTGK